MIAKRERFGGLGLATHRYWASTAVDATRGIWSNLGDGIGDTADP